MTFLQKLETTIAKNNSLVCVGLDPDVSKFPEGITDIFEFNKKIIDGTHDLVCCYKPQFAYYSALGIPGLQALEQTIKYIHEKYDLPVILDAKRGDIGPTAQKYADEAFKWLQADAVTVNPYLGFDSVEPFLAQSDKGIIILCRTSNPSASDFQDLPVSPCHPALDAGSSLDSGSEAGMTKKESLYLHVAKKVVTWDEKYNNCLMVVGATWSKQLEEIREIAPDMFFLIPGIGAQGGNLKNTLKNGLRKDKSGLIISSSRGIIYADNPRVATLKLRDEINKFR